VRILLVEDEPWAASVLAKGLRERAYAVDLARDGVDASYKASINDYDLVILDIMLPGKSGLDVCGELRRRGAQMPVLMLTARDGIEDRIAGLDIGADDYLTKPFDYRELLARIRALLRRGPTRHRDSIEVADLRIDCQMRRVTRAGRIVQLTAKEYSLLEYLARRASELVTRSEISEHVWDETFDPFSNLIEVYVQRLRRKIDAGHTPRLIRTRRGEGYMLTAEGSEGHV
jgi:DNA-binding response OmpR family regulator